MNRIYEDTDLLVLGDALYTCLLKTETLPNELECKVKFLLTHEYDNNDVDSVDLKKTYEWFMIKYHSGDDWNHKLVRKICERSLYTYLFRNYSKKDAQGRYTQFTQSIVQPLESNII